MNSTQILRQAIPQDVLGLCRRLSEAGQRAWVVGGCIRDLLLATQAPGVKNDWDIATDARPERVQQLFRRVIPTGIKHGTVTVVSGKNSYEVTTLRGETDYSDGRHPDHVYFVKDIIEDLARRDFTVNALAYDPLAERLLDPFEGRKDLAARQLRAVGVAAERFREDGLRVLRAARFVATLEMELEPATAAAITPALSSYRKVSPERVRDEWLKAMAAQRPSRAFQVMQEHGLLAITCPELEACHGLPWSGEQAPGLWAYQLRCVDFCKQPSLRHAALLHDVGEPLARAQAATGGSPKRELHAELGAELVSDIATRLRFSKPTREHLTQLTRHHALYVERCWSEAEVRRFMQQASRELLPDLLALQRTDVLAQNAAAEQKRASLAALEAFQGQVRANLAAQHPLEVRELAIGGRELLSLGVAGPRIGELLRELLAEVVATPELNTRQRLLERAEALRGAAVPGH